MIEVVNETRLCQLKALLQILAEEIDEKPGSRDLASLARQYREALREIEEIEGTHADVDEIGDILDARKRAGESRAVRPDRTALQ